MGISIQSKKEEKEIKGIQIGKEEFKLSLFGNDLILYLKTLRLNQKILDLVNTFWKRVRNYINVQKSVVFLIPTRNRLHQKSEK
jgi:hypothetical protein